MHKVRWLPGYAKVADELYLTPMKMLCTGIKKHVRALSRSQASAPNFILRTAET